MPKAIALTRLGFFTYSALAVIGMTAPARAATLLLQPFNTPNNVGVLSQVFPDAASFSSYVFDDFVLTERTQLESLSVFGLEEGNPLNPQPVFGGIYATPDVTTSSLLGALTGTYTPVPDAQSNRKTNLVFNLSGTTPLDAGIYYVSAWIQRNSDNGNNQPFFAGTSIVNAGAIANFQNPGNGFGYGSVAVPLTSLNPSYTYGLAFQLDGTPVAVPLESDLAGVTALAGLGLLMHRRCQRRQHQQPS